MGNPDGVSKSSSVKVVWWQSRPHHNFVGNPDDDHSSVKVRRAESSLGRELFPQREIVPAPYTLHMLYTFTLHMTYTSHYTLCTIHYTLYTTPHIIHIIHDTHIIHSWNSFHSGKLRTEQCTAGIKVCCFAVNSERIPKCNSEQVLKCTEVK